MSRFFMIGNTHFDPVWLWRWDEAMASIRATFRSALDRMKETPEFIYSFATPPVFEWIRQTDPQLFADIQQAVAQGRWELAEGWWVQPDCYGACGESYVRQGLYGQRWLQTHFGRLATCVFNIDSFGHSPMLPQILRKSGVDTYCFVRPEKRHVTLEDPLFYWQSPDGSRVAAYRAETNYFIDWDKLAQQHTGDTLVVYGVTDHGGAPTKEAIARIQSREDTDFSTVEAFFRSHTPQVTLTKELLTGDFGPYANCSRVKALNRQAEYALLNAERACLLAGRDCRALLTEGWKDVLFNQFHDILGGACIQDAYEDAEFMLGRAIHTANEQMHYALQSVTRRIRTPGKNPDTVWNIVAWNLNGSPYDGYMEAEVQWAHEFGWYDKGFYLEDGEGKHYACQVIREKSVIPRFRSRFIFRAEIPNLGYRAMKLVQTGEPVERQKIDPFHIRTDRLAIDFDENGTILLVEDRLTGKKLAGPLLQPVCYEDKGDTWAFNIAAYEEQAQPAAFEGFRVLEAGELFTRIKGVYRIGQSKLELTYCFYAGLPCFDVSYRVNWEDAHRVLKLVCPVENPEHLAAVPAGQVTRGENPADMPLGAWLRADGVTYIPRSMFAYNMWQNQLGLTVLRSPIYGDLRIGELDEAADYDIIDRGIVEGGLRVALDGDPWQAAESFCNSPVIVVESNHDGELPAGDSFFRIESEGVQLMALKACEDDDGEILRLAETAGAEREIGFTFRGQAYQTKLTPYEIQTLKLVDGTLRQVNMLEM